MSHFTKTPILPNSKTVNAFPLEMFFLVGRSDVLSHGMRQLSQLRFSVNAHFLVCDVARKPSKNWETLPLFFSIVSILNAVLAYTDWIG